MRQKSIYLGREKEDGNGVYINPKARSTHMHIVGSTGVGKSKFMEHLIREDIINNNGLCLIDPHGYLYDDIVRWCETKEFFGRKKILLFEPAEEGWVFSFNPLRVVSSTVSFHVDSMVQACAKVWGGEDTDKRPLLKRCLRVVFHALVEKKLSLLEAQYLMNPIYSELKGYITQGIQDQIIQQQWDYFNGLKESQFYDEFGSTTNRMMEFLSSPIIRDIIGQTERVIDFRKIMDEGYILLVNLAPKNRISDDNIRLLGTLIVNDLFMSARGRPEGSRPFYLYIDECARFVNKDIGRILNETRKFGLHLILAHQHLSQLKKAGEDIYYSVMTNAKTKVVFGGLDIDDAEVLAKRVFIGELDLEESKETLNKPTVVGHVKTWMRNYSHGYSDSNGDSHSASRGSSSSSSASESETAGGENKTKSVGAGSSSSNSFSETEGYSHSHTDSSSEGASETLKPTLEDRPTQVYSLQEQIYRAMALMVNQPTQHAIIKILNEETNIVKTPTIKPGYANDRRVGRFKKECYGLAEFAKPEAEAQEHLQHRLNELRKSADSTSKQTTEQKEPSTIKSTKKPKMV